MRRKDKEISNRKLIEEIMTKAEICRVAMTNKDQPSLYP